MGVLLYCGIQIFRLYQSSRHFFFQYRIRFFQQDPVGIWHVQIFPALFMILSLCVPISLLFFTEKKIFMHFLEFWVLVVSELLCKKFSIDKTESPICYL